MLEMHQELREVIQPDLCAVPFDPTGAPINKIISKLESWKDENVGKDWPPAETAAQRVSSSPRLVTPTIRLVWFQQALQFCEVFEPSSPQLHQRSKCPLPRTCICPLQWLVYQKIDPHWLW